VSEPVRPGELDLTAAVYGHNASESILDGNRVDYLGPRQHSPILAPILALARTLLTAAPRV
jgi:hypothetical protein